MDIISIDPFALMTYLAAVATISLILLVVMSIHIFKIKKKLKSIESSWHSFILGPHKRKHKYPLDHV